MTRGRGAVVATLALCVAIATAGCGLGPGDSSDGQATLTVTRDYGAEPMLEADQSDPPESETVIRFLDREAELSTRYGGGFVQSIDGLEGQLTEGRSFDWFFFVNGIESSRGAAEVTVRGGDRIWWDYRDWTDALRTPAVVGSWPEPFAQDSAGTERSPVRIECHGERGPCDAVSERLSEEGVDASIEDAQRGTPGAGSGSPAMRLLVGPWEAVRSDPVAAQLDDGPATSGVFARFEPAGRGYELTALDQRARTAAQLGPGAGLVAGLRQGDRPATWLVTGTDAEGVEEALTMLDAEHLADRYAVAGFGDRDLALPAEGSG